MKKFLVFVGIIFIISSVIAFSFCSKYADQSFDKYTRYYQSDSFPSLNKNVYVGGDAYNYIINGTYFTALAIYAVGFGIAGVLFLAFGVLIIEIALSHEKVIADQNQLLREIKESIIDKDQNSKSNENDEIPEI